MCLYRNLKILFIVSLIFTTSVVAQKQYKDLPVTKDRLVMALKTKALQTRQIVQQIGINGVDFKLTPDVESELVAAGARPEVLTAVRENYRASGTKPAPPAATGALSKAEVLQKLRSKRVSNGALLDEIETKGVSFETTSTVEKEIVTAGGSPAIIAALKNAYSNRGTVVETAGGSGSSKYDKLIENAVDLYNRDANSNLPAGSPGRIEAIQTLNQAITLQPNNPMAYQQLGFMTLYGTINGFSAAEVNFKKAIDLGGSAVFRVFHDHDGIFQNTCQGSLYVSKDGVRFESDDNRHTFDTTDANIKQVKTNSSWRRVFQVKSGSFKIVLNNEEKKDGDKFSFAPLTDNIEESKLAIRLIGK